MEKKAVAGNGANEMEIDLRQGMNCHEDPRSALSP